MKIHNLDGRVINWSLTGHVVTNANDRAIRSDLHLSARQLLRETFPTLDILEEVPIQLRKNTIVYLDFYLPLRKLCVEIQGQQHFKYIPFYHGSPAGFLKAKKRDSDKKLWCDINGINIIYFRWDEKIEDWKAKL